MQIPIKSLKKGKSKSISPTHRGNPSSLPRTRQRWKGSPSGIRQPSCRIRHASGKNGITRSRIFTRRDLSLLLWIFWNSTRRRSWNSPGFRWWKNVVLDLLSDSYWRDSVVWIKVLCVLDYFGKDLKFNGIMHDGRRGVLYIRGY